MASGKSQISLGKYYQRLTGRRLEFAGAFFFLCAAMMAICVLYIIGFIFAMAMPIFQKEGINFITGTVWDYNAHTYGILVYIVGTLYMTVVTLIIAVPLSLLTAIYLAEFAPSRVKNIIRPMIELLVGIPSVVYGIFGIFILADVFTHVINPLISGTLGWIWLPFVGNLFYDPNPGRSAGVLLASTVLAIMVLPTITVLSEEAIRSVPREYKEASYGVGATKWDTILRMILPVASTGIITAVVLGVMRAMGETMAIVMLLGNSDHMPSSVLDVGYAMTSKILNDMGYWIADDEGRSALFGIAAVLFVIEMLFVVVIRLVSRKRKMSLRASLSLQMKGVIDIIRGARR
jgi:phosphate transport system permease protein